jgi:hypothetical protein
MHLAPEQVYSWKFIQEFPDGGVLRIGKQCVVTQSDTTMKTKIHRFLSYCLLVIFAGFANAEAPAGETRELLSAHETEATFEGLKDHKCMGRTSACPDQCGHSGKLAVFKITKYLRYEKPGEYGDPKQEVFQVLIEDNLNNPKVPAAVREAIMALKPGDAVRLDWNHDYVSREGSKSPERPIVAVSPLMKAP